MLLWITAAVTAVIGVALILYSRVAHRDRRLVAHADRVTAPRNGQLVAVCGTLEVSGEPLRSPIRRRECALYYWNSSHQVPSTGEGTVPHIDYAGYGATPCVIRGSNVTARLGAFPSIETVAESGIASAETRDNLREFLRFARFSDLPKGEMFEYVEVIKDAWDGRSPVVKNFRRGSGYDLDKSAFKELSLAPGAKVCAIGIWSGGALVGTTHRGLVLYEGSAEVVAENLSSGAGCAIGCGTLLLAGAVCAALYAVLQ